MPSSSLTGQQPKQESNLHCVGAHPRWHCRQRRAIGRPPRPVQGLVGGSGGSGTDPYHPPDPPADEGRQSAESAAGAADPPADEGLWSADGPLADPSADEGHLSAESAADGPCPLADPPADVRSAAGGLSSSSLEDMSAQRPVRTSHPPCAALPVSPCTMPVVAWHISSDRINVTTL